MALPAVLSHETQNGVAHIGAGCAERADTGMGTSWAPTTWGHTLQCSNSTAACCLLLAVEALLLLLLAL